MSNYSIAIRTLGRAGEKYQKLLDSIAECNRQPEKVIVVIPERSYSATKDRPITHSQSRRVAPPLASQRHL